MLRKLLPKGLILTSNLERSLNVTQQYLKYIIVCLICCRMKEMQDNNLFGDDSLPNEPAPQITEISLRDIGQAVDLTEFRKQNLQMANTCGDFLLPVKETNVDECSTNVAFDWTPPQTNANALSPGLLSSSSFPVSFPETNTLACETNEVNEFDPFTAKTEPSSYATPFFDIEPTLETISETVSLQDQEHDNPSETDPCILIQKKTPNGDMFSDEYRPKRRELTFSTDSCPSRPASHDHNSDLYAPAIRRLSIPDTNTKDSRTFHPRKRQTVHGNRRDKSQRNFDIEKFSKEELLLMWKSSELELNDKLDAAVKDKQRLETKLTALKINMSTPV